MPDNQKDKSIEKPLPSSERISGAQKSPESKIDHNLEAEKIKKFEQARQSIIEEINLAENAAPPTIGPIGGLAATQNQQQKQIENILADGLEDVYLSLAPAKKQEFKRAGEETAKKITTLLRAAKINVGEIIRLIKKWLFIIPGVNKYFLEQEAKIKADEIIKIKNSQ